MRVYLIKEDADRVFLGECKDVWDKSFSDLLYTIVNKEDAPYMRVAEYEDRYEVDFGSYTKFIEIYKNGGNDYE